MTLPTQLVLRALLEEPAHEKYGLQIGVSAGLPSGTIHPILARLEGLGWLKSRWEEVDPSEQGRPRRRYYQLTSEGIEHARIALANARTQISDLPALRVRPVGGTT
jgi:PadR family transcriptional regulator PadR